jgi:hypothetical protein
LSNINEFAFFAPSFTPLPTNIARLASLRRFFVVKKKANEAVAALEEEAREARMSSFSCFCLVQAREPSNWKQHKKEMGSFDQASDEQ